MKSLLAISCFVICTATYADESSERQLKFFENQIRPLLVEHCYDCHSADSETSEGGLFLDSRSGWAKGGDSGPTIIPGDPNKSLLMEAISYENVDLQMPPDGKLTKDKIELLAKWIKAGAHDPREATPASTAHKDFDLQQRREDHWCWQPITTPSPPQLQSDWSQSDVDSFILKRLQENNLTPAPQADKRTLLRRITFAIIGLPPTQDEIQAFLDDTSENATADVIDRLLDSPHFGENWGQHWLDLMRFAETRGHEQDFPIPEAYRYRDYVIHAFNQDVPYDQFVTEHIAGDLMASRRLHPKDRTNQSIQGTGFWQLHDATHSPVDIRGDEALRMQNQIDVFSRSFLGLSLGCARCHDHKFDAISTRDYYAMYGYLQSSSYYMADVSDPKQQALAVVQLEKLTSDSSEELKVLLAEKLEAQAKLLPSYLVAAVQAPRVDVSSESVPEAIKSLADEKALDVATLWNLARYLQGDVAAESPLKLWSLLQQKGQDASRTTTELAQIRKTALQANQEAWKQLTVTKSVKDGERNYSPQNRKWTDAEIIEDFSTVGRPQWMTAGHRFRRAPITAGDSLLGTSADRPIALFAESPFATSERLSAKLTGLLRTKTFEITGDQIWYRYRGKGNAFLAVDSHRVVKGPLHGVLKRSLSTDKSGWQWASQSVRDYVGHRVHVELTGGPGFAVDRILFASKQPPEEALEPYDIEPVASLEELQEQTVSLLTYVGNRLAAGHANARDANLLNWWLDNSELFPPVDTDDIHQAFADFTNKKQAIEARIPAPVLALSLLDGSGEDEPVHIRGNHRNRTDEGVPRQPPEALGAANVSNGRGSGRLALAEKLTDPSNPLLARVYVNRVWHHLFGRGIVETVDDFGVMGKLPTHPELLDYLASEFMANGWSTKTLIRELMLSRTYQMSSRPDSANEERDPTNKFWHRMPVRRLTGEVIRDHLLAVSGRLDRKQFGPSVKVHITPFMRGNRTPKGSGPVDGNGRRSIYTEVRRNHLPAFLAAFDKPPPFMAIGKRTVSNSPTQSLILLNDPLVHDQAMLWAKRLLKQEQPVDKQIAHAFEQAYARQPDETELAVATEFLQQQLKTYQQEKDTADQSNELAWRDLCHTLINVKEFIHVN